MVPEPVLRIYHRNKTEFISVFKAAVISEAQFELLPELLDIFGEDAVKFLEIFSGRIVHVPPIRDLVAQMRRVSVWVALGVAKRTKQNYDESVASVANRLGMKKSEIRQIDESMGDLMNHLSMELRPGNGEEEDI